MLAGGWVQVAIINSRTHLDAPNSTRPWPCEVVHNSTSFRILTFFSAAASARASSPSSPCGRGSRLDPE